MKLSAEQQNTHSIKIDNDKKGTIINHYRKVKFTSTNILEMQ